MTPDENLFRQLWSDTSITPWHQRPEVRRVVAVVLASAAVTGMLTWAPRANRDTANVGTSRSGLSRGAMNRSMTTDRSILVAAALVGAANTTAVHAQQSTYAEAVLASRPSGYWRFEDAEGPVRNSAGVAQDGTIGGTATRAVESMNTVLGSCIRFQAGHVTVPGSAAVRPSPQYSFEAWVKVEAPTSPSHVISVGRDIFAGSFNIVYYGCGADGCTLGGELRLSNSPPLPGTFVKTLLPTTDLLAWMHIVVTFDQPTGKMRMFINGDLATETDVPSTSLGANSSNLVIGMHAVSGFPYYFRGLIDEVAVYQRALTAEEVRTHYCAADGLAATCCPADLYPNGVVNGADLGILLSEWGSATPVSADLNGDGTVDGIDLGALLGAWGPCTN
jgi:hypothetical protein